MQTVVASTIWGQRNDTSKTYDKNGGILGSESFSVRFVRDLYSCFVDSYRRRSCTSFVFRSLHFPAHELDHLHSTT